MQPRVWIEGENLAKMDNIIRMFDELGYIRVNGAAGENWDLLWPLSNPFLDPSFKVIKSYQRMNYIYGTNCITKKVLLVT